MRRTIATLCVLAMMSGGIWARQSAAQSAPQVQKTEPAKKTTSSKKRKTGKPAAQAAQLPSQTTPPIPATLMNSAPVAPQVTMERGLLTIDAPNSTLSDVLKGVHIATGAVIEGANPSERVAVKLGPGEPEQVIASLLRGTTYDYVILGSLGKQDMVTRVLLTQQSSQASSGGGQSQPAPSPQQTRQPSTDESMPDRTVSEDAAAQSNPDGEPDQAQQQPPQPQQDPNQPKTPEQLFKELQQLEQQKQPK